MTKKIISGSTIKIIAIISMLIDHFGQIIVKNGIVMNATYSMFNNFQFSIIMNIVDVCHILGRIAFPIFCFLIVEGFLHTHNVRKYILRLTVFAIISEPIYDLSFSDKIINIHLQNVIFTLLLGLLTITLIKKYNNNYLIIILASLVSSAISFYLKMDGSYYGILLIVTFYLFKEKTVLQFITAGLIMYLCGLDYSLKAFIDPYFITSLSSLIFISLYNGRRGLNMKYIFYIFYPAHLLCLYLISQYLIVPNLS
ncbi:TraX family protein [Anaerovorax odorimutans]|uniref:TraX family protein n=1 Tax=Anaerovorax odorimutans TaxID=109327 RepID=UPI000418B76C|nr:TraX family protein [Anaerovorax odorimutans]